MTVLFFHLPVYVLEQQNGGALALLDSIAPCNSKYDISARAIYPGCACMLISWYICRPSLVLLPHRQPFLQLLELYRIVHSQRHSHPLDGRTTSLQNVYFYQVANAEKQSFTLTVTHSLILIPNARSMCSSKIPAMQKFTEHQTIHSDTQFLLKCLFVETQRAQSQQ